MRWFFRHHALLVADLAQPAPGVHPNGHQVTYIFRRSGRRGTRDRLIMSRPLHGLTGSAGVLEFRPGGDGDQQFELRRTRHAGGLELLDHLEQGVAELAGALR